jgi:tetratricopeptide (TPR) repeat protein
MNTPLFAAAFCFWCVTFTGGETQDQLQRRADLPEFETILALLQQGRPAEAEKLLDEANWRSSNETFDFGDSRIPAYGFYSPLLVATYVRINRYADAERLSTDGIHWSEKRYGDAALQLGRFVDSLADLYRLEGKYAEAEPLYARSLSIYRLRKFDDCLLAQRSYVGLAEVYIARKRPSDAVQLLRPAIEKCTFTPAKAELLNVYAISLENDGRPDEESRATEEADRIGIKDPRFQQENRDLLRARLLASQGYFEEARVLCQKWISTFEVPDGTQSDRRLVIPLVQYQRILQRAGDSKEAERVGARLDAIRAKYDMKF